MPVWGLAGIGLSLVLTAVLFWRLDWTSFRASLEGLQPAGVGGTLLCLVAGIGLRALRWQVLAQVPLRQYAHFWRAASIGYLGNLIYPARAGELLRMAAVHRFAGVPAGVALVSAVLDRMADALWFALILSALLWKEQDSLVEAGLAGMAALAFAAGILCLALLLSGSDSGRRWLRRLPGALAERALRWQREAGELARSLWRLRPLSLAGSLTVLAFATDCLAYGWLLGAFGWSLPPMAAVTLALFIAAGTALPSAPAYVGIYQLACVLALSFHGIDESQALAYSVVIQLLVACVVGVQGGVAMASYGMHWRGMQSLRRDAARPAP